MKALTIRQPWAWAVLAGGKNVENRTRDITGGHTGQILIHAGQQLAPIQAFNDVTSKADTELPVFGTPRVVALTLGAFIGTVDIAGTHPATTCGGTCSTWADTTGTHITLTNPQPLRRAVPALGRLGLWNVDDPDLREVRRWL